MHTFKSENILFRFRQQDTPNGIGSETFSRLLEKTGLTKTELIHFALRKLADQCLPRYLPEDADLTDEQFRILQELSPATGLPLDLFTERIFYNDRDPS